MLQGMREREPARAVRADGYSELLLDQSMVAAGKR